jgi:hypothetical protein
LRTYTNAVWRWPLRESPIGSDSLL